MQSKHHLSLYRIETGSLIESLSKIDRRLRHLEYEVIDIKRALAGHGKSHSSTRACEMFDLEKNPEALAGFGFFGVRTSGAEVRRALKSATRKRRIKGGG